MEATQHPTYQFLLQRQQQEPGRPIFLIIGGKPVLAQLDETENDELSLFDLVVTEEGKPAKWRLDDFKGLEWRVSKVLTKKTAKSIEWLEERSRSFDGGAFFITSSLEVDPEADGATSMGKATARGALGLWGEWDDIPEAEQLERIKQLEAMGFRLHRVTSGGDSVHWHIPFDRLAAWEEAMPLLKQVTALMGSDMCCVSKARRMRLPGLSRKKGDKITEQKLLGLANGVNRVADVRNALDGAFKKRGWSYSDKRWAMYRRNLARAALGRDLNNGWKSPEQAWSCPAEDLYVFTCNDKADSDGGTLPPVWLRTEHHLGKRIRKAQDLLFEKHGLIGAYELCLTEGTMTLKKKAADGQPFAFDFYIRHGGPSESFPAEVCGKNPFSETNHSGSSFVLFGENRRWWDRKRECGGQLAELLLYSCPGIADPEEPSDREQKVFLLWISKLAGLNVEESAQLFDDGVYGEEMQEIERLVQASIKADGNPLETEAVLQQAQQMKISVPNLLRLKLHQLSGTLRTNGSTSIDECVEHPDNIDTPVVFDFLYRNHVGFVGEPGSGKTTFAGFLAERIINGNNLVISNRIQKTASGRVLIVSSDAGTTSIKHDLIKQGVDFNNPEVKERVRFLSDLTYNDMSLIVKEMQEHQPDLTFFDSFLTLKAPGIKIGDDACALPLYFLTRANGVAFPRHLIITSIHTQRASSRHYLGSTAIRAGLDAMATYSPPDKKDPDEPSGPVRLLSYRGEDTKCRHGNKDRVWSIRYEEMAGTWEITEVLKTGNVSVSSRLRSLIEAEPTRTWMRLNDFLDAINAGKEFSNKSTRRTASRHLAAMEDLIDTRSAIDSRTKQKVTEYRVNPSVYSALVNTERGYVAKNVVGEKPTTFKGKATSKQNDPPKEERAEKPARRRPAKKAKASAQPSSATKPAGQESNRLERGENPSHKVGPERPDLNWHELELVLHTPGADQSSFTRPLGKARDSDEGLEPLDPNKPPTGAHKMVVFEKGAWRNGWRFAGINPSGMVALSAWAVSDDGKKHAGVYERFPVDPSRVRVCIKRQR